MELTYDQEPHPYFAFQRKLELVPLSIRRNKVHPRPELSRSVDPIVCIPASSMKFSGLGTTMPGDCFPAQLIHLRSIDPLQAVRSVEVQSNQCGWSLSK